MHCIVLDDFSLEQIYRLWDKVLTSNSQLPFYLSYAIMKQLREVLLPLDFNSCILLFSSLPSINIDEFIRTAKTTFKHTPPSITRPNFVHEEYGHAADRWWEVRVPLDDLQGELFPRLSVMDLIGTKFHFVVIDIRAHDEFALLSYPGAVHFNPATDALDRLDAFRGKHLVVVTNKDGVRQGIAVRTSISLFFCIFLFPFLSHTDSLNICMYSLPTLLWRRGSRGSVC
jgi:hypothetical protein